jgi:hypothetical protein
VPRMNFSPRRAAMLLAPLLLLTACSSAPPRTSTPPAAAASAAIPPLSASAKQLPRSETHSPEVERSLDELLPTPMKPALAASSARPTTKP